MPDPLIDLVLPATYENWHDMPAAELIGRCDAALEDEEWDAGDRSEWIAQALSSDGKHLREFVESEFEIEIRDEEVRMAARGLAAAMFALNISEPMGAARVLGQFDA